MPAGLEGTLPGPVPFTFKARSGGTENLAVTSRGLSMFRMQVREEPEHPPPVKPAKVDPGPGCAVSVTVSLNGFTHDTCVPPSLPQSMPAGDEVTYPLASTGFAIAPLTM